MFKLEANNNIILDSKYIIDSDSIIMNTLFDGGGQLFLGKYDRIVFIDINEETKKCYGVSLILDAISFHEINYNLFDCGCYELIYNDYEKNKINIYDGLILNYYVDFKNNLILIGNPNLSIKPICFFNNTYAVIENDKLKLLIIHVDNNIINAIKKLKKYL